MNFVDDYMFYSSSNEAPIVYHKWAAISALSHLMGPRIWTHIGGYLSYYPNMYVNLVGLPGLMKSTALYQARELVTTVPYIAQSPAATSKEGIVKLMGMKDSPSKRSYKIAEGQYTQYTQLAIFASEIVSLLNAAGNAMGTIEFLTDIWDKPGKTYHEFFKNSGEQNLISPYISILACITPETLKSLITSKVISSGMSRRQLFIYAKQNGEPQPFIIVSPEQQAAWDRCIVHAKKLQDVWGKFEWTDEADSIYQSWYVPFKKSIQQEASPILRNFYMSKAEYTIKVSMLLAMAEYEPKLVHTAATFSLALSMISSVEKGACNLFEGSGRNDLSEILPDVDTWLINHPGWHQEFDLLRYFWKDMPNGKDDMRSVVDQLSRLGKIDLEQEITRDGVFRKIRVKNPS